MLPTFQKAAGNAVFQKAKFVVRYGNQAVHSPKAVSPMEAIGVGTPVIASDIPPHREFLRTQVRFFTPNDVIGLADAMAAVLGARGGTVYPSPTPLHDVTIEACAARFLPGLQRLLA